MVDVRGQFLLTFPAIHIGVNLMMRTQKSVRRLHALPAIAFGAVFVLTSSAFAAPAGEPDIPSIKPPPQPRTVEQEIRLANDYFVGRGVTQDLQQSAYWFERAAESGDPPAEMQIGYFYEAGIGVFKNPALAAHWYQLAASGGLATAKVSLGILYFYGNGVKQNVQLAAQLFEEAARKGSGLADYYLGKMCSFGMGVPQDEAAAEQWYVRGAERRNPQAEYALGMLLFDRKDHAHDVPRAAALLRDSVAAGDVPAMFALGLLLVRNPGLAKSSGEAVTLLNDSADAGIWKSSMVLGVMARDGRGVPIDPASAYHHFRVAALQGGDEAKTLLDRDIRNLSQQLGLAQAAALDSQAENWHGQHHIVLEFVYRGGGDRIRFPDYALAVPESGSHTMQMLPAASNLDRQRCP
jgi:uncharacterized protein